MKTSEMTKEEIRAWGDPRETSYEVAEAILWLARSENEAQRIWESATDTELNAITERATKNGLVDAADLQWGVSNLAKILEEAAE
jgi:hypothetical protein